MKWTWIAWGVGSAVAAAILGVVMTSPERLEESLIDLAALPIDRTVFLPGATTDGHYQIELDCDACHTRSFGDRSSMQEACAACHGEELERVDDSHPRSKFTDPRNADRVAVLDARLCVTCHQEHRPEITSTMGLSLPGDYCYRCHEKIGEERPTHDGLPFDGCASVGCHNFHDNRALYEDFLALHRDAPDFAADPRVPLRDLAVLAVERGVVSGEALGPEDHDAPADVADRSRWIEEWAGTRHAEVGVNCSGCHDAASGGWVARPGIAVCADCHGPEHEGFLVGRHGMRLAAGLSPMTPGEARLPMRADAAASTLDCNTCHAAHAYDTAEAAVEACLGCHADDHSLAYRGSPHERLWLEERSGVGRPGSGVSCATCHLPRVPRPGAPGHVLVAHAQNDFLRPREKMIRSSCMDCHGLAFSIDALADPALVVTNFRGRPTREVESIHFATKLRWDLEGREPPWAYTEEENDR